MERRLNIPEEHQEPLARFLALPDSEADAFIAALHEAPPSLRRRDLVEAVSDRTSLSKTDSAAMVRVILSLFMVGEDFRMGSEGVTEEVALAAEESGRPDLKLDAKRRETLKSRLRRALEEPAVGVTAKALSVALAHKYLLHQARILTDIRPVFTRAVTDSPAAFVVSHVLRLECHVDDDDEKFFVALSSEDLVRLAEVVKRAQDKEETLRRTLNSCKIPFLALGEGA